ncbi:MAG: CopG family transcriptional regulator [Solirubrobacteraceae bacterium]
MTTPPRSKTGIEITDDLAGRLASEAETGYDLSDAKRVGRRSLAGKAGTSPRVNFRTTAQLQARAQARAELEGKTVSEIAREALERYIG